MQTMGAMHGVVDFLYDEKGLKGVDSEFKPFVMALHRIPYVASFGVSCSGHFREERGEDPEDFDCEGMNEKLSEEDLFEGEFSEDGEVDLFEAHPWGHLNVIIDTFRVHAISLLGEIRTVILGDGAASFKKIDHSFGPPEGSCLEVWEIRFHDNACFGELPREKQSVRLAKKRYPEIYANTKLRCAEIRARWESLAAIVNSFADERGFGPPDILKRAEELEF